MMSPDVVALGYERMLTDMIVRRDLATLDQECGRGCANGAGVEQVALYILLSVSNDDHL